MPLHAFIHENMEAILVEWEKFARALPPGTHMDVRGLRDDAKEILETIAQDMTEFQSEEEQEEKSKGEKPSNKALEFAQRHSRKRHQEGFDFGEIVSEYRALRASVIRLWTDEMESADRDTLYQLTRFNEEIDQALTYAIKQYSEEVDRSRQSSLAEVQESGERYRSVAEMLRQADLRKDEFLVTLAHELRNPLAPIQAGIEILRLAKGDCTATKRTLEMMGRQMVHLVRLVDDLMDVSRIARGKVTLRLEKVDVNSAIQKALEATSTSIYADERQVFINLPLAPLVAKADPVRLVQIVGNLLSNASKHTDERGLIWVTASREGQHIKISVRDNGIGIAPDMLGKLFVMFMQVDSDRRSGLGMGLALVRSLVELHGGTVEARSEGLGQGSEFIVCLPLFEGEPSKFSGEDEAGKTRLEGKRVLIADDNKDVAESLAMLLALLGGEVRAVNDGPSTLALLDEFQPDLVLLDIGMPGMDGYEVARRIRAHKAGKVTRVVAVTGWGRDEDRQRTFQAGFDDHLVKPIGMKDLEKAIAVWRRPDY